MFIYQFAHPAVKSILISSLFQVGNEFDIKLENVDVFAVMARHIYHVGVRDTLGRIALQYGDFFAPFCGRYANKTVVRSVEPFDKCTRKAERGNVP